MNKSVHNNKTPFDIDKLRNIIVITIWILLIIICFFNRDKITVDAITNMAPKNTMIAILVMLALFAVKSLTFFVYGGILYAASGILFPLPLAILVNTLGSIIMTSLPFYIGRRLGKNTMVRLTEKYPRLSLLTEFQSKNEFFFSFFVRIVGCLPSDPVSMYIGSTKIRYSRYILGTLLGLSTAIVSFSIMGMSADDITSPAFIISATVEITLMITSIAIYLIWRKRTKKKISEGNNADKKQQNQHIGNAR